MTRVGRRVSRMQLRHRLVAGFVATMFILLTGAGGFVYWRVQYALDLNLNNSLAQAAAALAPRVTRSGQLPVDSATLARVDGFQILDSQGDVLDYDAPLGSTVALYPVTLRRALTGPVRQDVGDLLPASNRPLRLYATPVPKASPQGRLVLVVAIGREQRDEALRELLLQLTAAGLGTLLLTAVVGDLLARAALRPVETYRRQAAEIATGATDLRLDVPVERDDEISRLGHTLNDMLEALADALARERRFINDASHELRTPVTRLTSRVQLTLRRHRSVEQHEQALAEIAEDLSRLTQLADELLELGTRQQPQVASDPYDLAAVTLKVVDARTTLAPRETVYGAAGSLVVEAAGPAPVALDSVTVRRVLDNLLDNCALHGSPPVTVAVDRAGGWARLMVCDSGAGMPPEMLKIAAGRFARSAEARARPGAGLGLALVSSVVLQAGGQLRLCHAGHHHLIGKPVDLPCTHGLGMTVTVLLPLAGGLGAA